MDQGEEGASVRYHVDLNAKKLRMEPERDLILEAKHALVVGQPGFQAQLREDFLNDFFFQLEVEKFVRAGLQYLHLSLL
jgi:hypothetical protein